MRIPKFVIGTIASLAMVGGVMAFNGEYPDNPVANQIQMAKSSYVKAELTPLPNQGQVNGRTALILIHGLHRENDADPVLSEVAATRTFETFLTNCRGVFSNEIGVNFDERFAVFYFRYDPSLSPEENGRRLWAKVEGHPELTMGDTSVILATHSQGGWVGLMYRSIEDKKFSGMLGAGVPLHGAVVADPVLVEKGCRKLMGGDGPLADRLVKMAFAQTDFHSDGMRWLRPSSRSRYRLLSQKPLDEKCYFYAGEIQPVGKDPFSVIMGIATLFDATYITHDGYQQSLVYYPFGASLVEASGGGKSDGVVSVDSAMGKGIEGGAHFVNVGPIDHAMLIRSSGELALHRRMAWDLWRLYQAIPNKQDPKFGGFDEFAPSGLGPAKDLQGFVTKVGGSNGVWWQDSDRLFLSLVGTDEIVSIRFNLPEGREVDIHRDGRRVAIPTDQGLVVADLQTGETRRLPYDRVVAVGWWGDNLVFAKEDEICVMDPTYSLVRTVVRDETLSVSSRLIARDGVVYWSNINADGSYSHFGVSANLHHLTLDDSRVRKLAEGRPAPLRLVDQTLLEVYQEQGMTKFAVYQTKWWDGGSGKSGGIKIIDRLITEDILKEVTDIAVDRRGQVYLVVDRQVCRLDMALADHYSREAKNLLERGRAENLSEVTLYVDTAKLLQVLGAGGHLGAN